MKLHRARRNRTCLRVEELERRNLLSTVPSSLAPISTYSFDGATASTALVAGGMGPVH